MQGTANFLASKFWPEVVHPKPMVVFSPRLKSTAGKFGRDNNKLILATRYYERYGPIGMIEVLLHELSHWAVFAKHGYAPPDHGKEWEYELTKTGLDPVEVRNCEVDW